MKNPFRDPDNRCVSMLKSRFARLLCAPPVGAAVIVVGDGIVRRRGLRIDTRSSAVSNRARASLFWGFYEGAEQRIVNRCLQDTEVIVELGTSIGVLSSLAAQLGGVSRIIGVEANPRLITLAETNIKYNASHAAVEIVHAAVDYSSRCSGNVEFASMGEHTSSVPMVPSTKHANGFHAPGITLADILESRGVTGSFSLIMDIEGSEAGLLLRDSSALTNCTQIIAEFHETRFEGVYYSAEDLFERACQLGFHVQARYGQVAALGR